jgi:hypothetical protein
MILKPQIVVSGGYRGSNDPVCEVAPVTIATLPLRSLIDCSCSVGVRSGPRIMRACCRFDSLTIIELRCRTAVLKGGKGVQIFQEKLELTPSCCIFDSISRLDDCIRLFCTLRMQTAEVPGVVKHFIPSRGYYEWKNEARGKQPYYCALTANQNSGIWMLCRFCGAGLRFCREWQAKKAERKLEPISCVRGRES